MSPILCEGQVRPVRQQGTDVQSPWQERPGMITIYAFHIKHMLLYLGVAIRIRNPNPTPFLDKKHNPHPNPQFKLRIRIVDFLKLL